MNKEEFLKKIEIELKISKNSDYTIRNYLEANKKFIESTGKELEDIDSEDVKVFMIKNLLDKSSSSIILFLSSIKYAFNLVLGKDITSKIKRPKREKRLPKVLSRNQIKKLLSSLKTKKSKLMVSLMYACGFRVSELINLKISDLDFEEKIGYIHQSKGKKDRTFNIPKFLTAELKDHVKNQKG